MTKIKFYDCFTENRKVSIEDMVTSNGRLRRQYNPDALYCPLCKKARLKFTSATSQRVAYLATWPGSIHEDNCRYSFEPIPKREVINYYKQIEGDATQLRNILDAHLQLSLRQRDIPPHGLFTQIKTETIPMFTFLLLTGNQTKKVTG